MFLRRPVHSVLGLLALSALLVPASATAHGTAAVSGASIRAQLIRSAAAPVGGAVTQQELPGCSNPSEPFAGPSQGCADRTIRSRSGHKLIFDDERLNANRGPRQTTSLDGSFNRGPRQTTSLDGSINPETGGLVVDSVSRTKGFGFIKDDAGSERTYNSALASTPGVMGYGWSFPYAMSVRVYRGTATVTQENGSKVVFKTGADGQFHAAPRVIASFQRSSNGRYTLTRGSSSSPCPSYLLSSCDAFTFSNGHLSKVTSAPKACKSTEVCGNGLVRITRDGAGRPTSATADSGDRLTFGYTGGHITSITGPGGVSEQFTYDGRGNLSSSTDPNGNTTHYTYGAAHRLTSVRDPLGRTTRYEYDASGRVITVTDPLGNQRGFTSNAVHHNTRITSPEGRTVVLSYEHGELVDVAAGPAGSPPLAEWTFAYDPTTLAGTQTIDPLLRKVHAVHNGDGMPLSVTDALGHTTTFTYNDSGRRASVTDPMGVKTTFTFDDSGNVLTRSTPNTSSGTKRVVTWISVFEDSVHPGDMTSSIDPLGNETDYTYDSRGNVASVTDPLGNTWNASGDLLCGKTNHLAPRKASASGSGATTITDPLGHTKSYTCDANGNVLTTTDGNGATTTNTYDADDELSSATDPAGRTTTYSYDADGRLTAVHMPGGSTSHATYGADGELTTTVDPAGGTRSFTYDALGRMASDTDQLARKTTFAYDAVGNLTSTTDPAGVTTTNTYDADRHVLKTRFENGDIPTENDFAYDLDGRRTSMTDGTGTTTYEYDSLGHVTRYAQNGGVVVHRSGYDLAGNRTSIQYPNGQTVTMKYDGNGQMTQVTDWLGNTTQFQYDDAARLTGQKVYDPTKTYSPGDTAIYNTSLFRNAANQIIHIQVRDAFGNAAASFGYTRAADGRITSAQSTGVGDPQHSYDYDLRARLGSYDGSQVTFDSRSNVTRLPDGSTLSYDAGDQLTAMQTSGLSSAFSYDADGRRIASSSAASLHSFAWDAAGDLASFSDNGATTTYTYNGDGQRTSSSSSGVTHSFVWDSRSQVWNTARTVIPFVVDRDPPMPMLLSDGTHSFIYGPGGMPIEQIDNADHALFLGEDAQGSVRLITDVSGNVLGTASYDAFGNQAAQSGESSPFGFDGMYRDAESGLYAMSCAVYDPATGQNLAKSNNCTASCKINVCGDGRWVKTGSTPGAVVYSGTWMVGAPRSGEGCGNGLRTEFAILSKREKCDDGNSYDDLRVGDGVDEDCNGHEALCVESPYGAGGGDPVNALVTRAVLKSFFVKGAGS